jgi:hypothetical protein
MARFTAEERSAEYFRAGARPAEPPRGMTAAGRKVWRSIVASKPVDWFDGATLEVLRFHAENIASAQAASRDLRKVKPGTPQFRAIAGDMKSISVSLGHSSRQLRLTVLVDVQGQKAGERGVVGDGNVDLIGGPALRVVD